MVLLCENRWHNIFDVQFAGIFVFLIGKALKMQFPKWELFGGGGVCSNAIFMGQPLSMAIFCIAALPSIAEFLCVQV